MAKAKLRKALVVIKTPLEDIFDNELAPALAGLLREFRLEYALLEVTLHSGNPTSMIVPIYLVPALYSAVQNDRTCRVFDLSVFALPSEDLP